MTDSVTPGAKQDLVIKRVFDAPVEQVWNAWTDPAYVRQWWGPDGFTAPVANMDVREGGTSLLCMSSPNFGEHYSTWQYRSVEPMKQIVYIHNLADRDGNAVDPVSMGMPPDFPQNQLHVITFNALSNNRTELTVTEHDWTAGQMMQMSELGMNQCLDKMARALNRGVSAGS
ncbi:MAG: hypothetical protein AVDCRST_MAG93-4243 [uncultured Chloroflexia bacterium]|uniref:Activator of Hsp90 ATPase homologue 1/2-like C-terminal domain-containing protein n=1 Tax=uncultured Chloroflexia bacterium TaxID=1672391 RepID=A0A6J4K4P0_9CHLR|nr:MAG: hypothetical protein AVDCRST_MAG93-4243 [uncultured Chloroflexia bacterium]